MSRVVVKCSLDLDPSLTRIARTQRSFSALHLSLLSLSIHVYHLVLVLMPKPYQARYCSCSAQVSTSINVPSSGLVSSAQLSQDFS